MEDFLHHEVPKKDYDVRNGATYCMLMVLQKSHLPTIVWMVPKKTC